MKDIKKEAQSFALGFAAEGKSASVVSLLQNTSEIDVWFG